MKGTRRPCLVCGIPCFWEAYDLQWAHMGWTKNGGNEFGPHHPEVETEGELA
jgi:hypothetical protein